MSSIEAVKHLRIPLQELRDASNEFSDQNFIGKGGFGRVYKGESVKHGKIAVKVLDPRLGLGDHQFRKEIDVLSVHKHENLTSLIGFCDEDQKKILVYRYEGNGSLDKHLSNADLTWVQRLQICLDAARGLQYLHEHRIIHRDVKSANILLDENWKAKISDFGFCREIGPANEQTSYLVSGVFGTLGYIDPEYYATGYLTQRYDVYSFGVVLFEVLCGRPAIVRKHKDSRDFLTNLIKTHWRNNRLDEIIYPYLQDQIKRASLLTFTSIAYQCLMIRNERPTMKTVVELLQEALKNQLKPRYADDSGFAPHLQKQSGLSASSPQSTHVSSSQSWEYDVFISFRGKDTRKTFVDHLYMALLDRDIKTYMDDDPISEEGSISSSLIKSIQKSRIAIIIFSKNYADSSCLGVLEFVMKNRDERGQIVMPIFYDVDPSEVRKQTGHYRKALGRHELKYSNNKVQSWREALKKAANLSGWECSNRHEADLIRQICDDISHKLGYYLPSYEASGETSANTYLSDASNVFSIEAVKHLQIPLQELSDASNGFSDWNLIGKGGFGNVYKGESVKHGKIALKVLDPGRGQGDHQFNTEIAVLSVHKHENIASLVGFCDEDGQKILVFKYECNGSLDRHLSNTDLTWIQRLQICLDVARGLQYLHEHRIIYGGDVKSANILLDENWKAKISDFGFCRELGTANEQTSFLISKTSGTLGYIDPEYYATGYLTQSSDVYSFGVVLFEVLSGRPTIVRNKDNLDSLTNLIKTHWRSNTLDEIIFSDLQKQIKPASFLTFTKIAYQCLMSGNEHPTMKKVMEQLQEALKNQLTSSVSDDSGFATHLQGQSGLPAYSLESTHVSSSPSWEYDVFISFRGEDTRRNFIDHLYSALVYRQIITYLNKSSREVSITSSLIKGVQKSRIAIILFSQNYAGSSWCLDEVAFIMKISNEQGKIVMPIFYDVDPSEVRKQTGLYGAALDRHELKYDNNKVQSWREALTWAGGLSGWDSRNRREVDLIRQICDDISHKLGYYWPSFDASGETSANTYLIGMETRMQELISLIEVGSGGVNMVGIYGMGGSGKSTLAYYVYDEISHEFEGSCFVKNVRARSRIHGLKTLQEEILSNVLKSKVNLEQGTYMMEKSLRQNSVLIVLDDVHHTDHLKMLAGSQNWFGKGSRVIFTTSNRYLLNDHSARKYNVRMLDDKEAIEAFSWHAFGKREPVQGFEEDSLSMVSKCGGHPSVLKSLGSFLHGKDRSEWMRILDRLEGIPVDEILKKFKIRDDGVDRKFPVDEILKKLKIRDDGSR